MYAIPCRTVRCIAKLFERIVFAKADYDPAKPCVEGVLDSSRYFVVRVEDNGRKAYIGMGFVENWSTLAGLRVILGLFEAGFFPGEFQSRRMSSNHLAGADIERQAAFICSAHGMCDVRS